jgi:hypothetical protein
VIIFTTKRRQREREDRAWSDGYNYGDEEVAEFVEGKDAFIAQQADLIVGLICTPGAIDWDKVPAELQSRLADYA